jgi:hypothetical protein
MSRLTPYLSSLCSRPSQGFHALTLYEIMPWLVSPGASAAWFDAACAAELIVTFAPAAHAAPEGWWKEEGGGPRLCTPSVPLAAYRGSPQVPPTIAWVRLFAYKRKCVGRVCFTRGSEARVLVSLWSHALYFTQATIVQKRQPLCSQEFMRSMRDVLDKASVVHRKRSPRYCSCVCHFSAVPLPFYGSDLCISCPAAAPRMSWAFPRHLARQMLRQHGASLSPLLLSYGQPMSGASSQQKKCLCTLLRVGR